MNILERFRQIAKAERTEKDVIVEQLLAEGHIDARQATILLNTLTVNINSDKLEMSSGAKIVGGSDFETTDFGKR